MHDGKHSPMWSEDRLDRALDTLRAGAGAGTGAAPAARARLMLAIGDRPDDRGGPWQPPPGALSVLDPRRPPADPVRRLGGRRARWLGAAAAVGVLATAALAVQSVRPDGPSAEAAELLHRSADLVSAASDPPIAPGQFRYVVTHAWYRQTFVLDRDRDGQASDDRPFSFLAEGTVETWIPADPDAVWTERRSATGNVRWQQGGPGVLAELSPADAALVRESLGRSSTTVRGPGGGYAAGAEPSWGAPTAKFLAGLPRDPRQLLDRLRHDAPKNSRGDVELLVNAADLLRSGLAPADLRAALYNAVSLLPGLVVTDDAANLDGRRGVSLGMTDPAGEKEEIVLDPKDGAFIGERETDADGTVSAFTSVGSGVAAKAGVAPGG